MSTAEADRPARRGSLPVLFVATGGGLGLLGPAPGTWASLAAGAAVAAAAGLLSGWWPTLVVALAAGLALLAGLATCASAARHFGRPDPGQVVIDEIAGTWTALALLPPTALAAAPWFWAGLAVALFRLFDIVKPWPVDACERLPGARGVMADDLAAGVLAGLGCHALKLLVLGGNPSTVMA